MKFLKWAAIGLISAAALNAPAQAATTTVASSLSLSFGFGNDWFVSDGSAGTWAGCTNWSCTWMLERFVLPAYIPGTSITNANFLLHTPSEQVSMSPLGVYEIADSWNESTLTRTQHPDERKYSTEIMTFIPRPGDLSLDITSAVNKAYHGDGVLTLMVASTGAEKDEIWIVPGRYLALNISAVPEPETYAMTLLGLGLVGVAARRKRRAA
nr:MULTISPECIES: DNRLRE domain-containing protein [unclassified Duganella]